MLAQLTIRDLAVIDALSLEFSSGLNVITGETGSGKSVILEALGILLGDRASSEVVRRGRERAEIEGLLLSDPVAALEEAGIESDGEIILRRLIHPEGRSRVYINDHLSTVRVLKTLGDEVADIHGQFEHQSLLLEERQLDLLDRSADLAGLRDETAALYSQLRSAQADLEAFDNAQRDRLVREDLLRFQVSEIEEADLRPSEEGFLEEEHARLSNVEKLNELSSSAYARLYGDDGAALERVLDALRALEEIASVDPGAALPEAPMREAAAHLEDAVAAIRTYRDSVEADPQRLDFVSGRIDKIRGLKRKYGETVQVILGFCRKAREELEIIDDGESHRDALDEKFRHLGDLYRKTADDLGKKRHAAARRLEPRVTKELGDLDMEGAAFRIRVEPREGGPTGTNHVRFLIRTNPGDDFKPLARIVSGGELSRIMLAIKSIMGDRSPVIVFDEVDAGIGGETADAVGRRLKKLARGRQVICVTHLPQIAAYGDHHLSIRKNTKKGATEVSATTVQGEERVRELARMLGGGSRDTAIRHGRELLANRS